MLYPQGTCTRLPTAALVGPNSMTRPLSDLEKATSFRQPVLSSLSQWKKQVQVLQTGPSPRESHETNMQSNRKDKCAPHASAQETCCMKAENVARHSRRIPRTWLAARQAVPRTPRGHFPSCSLSGSRRYQPMAGDLPTRTYSTYCPTVGYTAMLTGYTAMLNSNCLRALFDTQT